jgi:hypothetical protein
MRIRECFKLVYFLHCSSLLPASFCLAYSSNLKMDSSFPSETSAGFLRTTRHNFPVCYGCGTLFSYIVRRTSGEAVYEQGAEEK